MGASTIPAPSGAAASDNWVLISSVTPTNGSSSVSFTSISGYKKLMFKSDYPQLQTTGTLNLRFNSDSSTNYSYASLGSNGSTSLVAPLTALKGTGIPLGTGDVNNNFAQITINETNTSGVKNLSGFIRSLTVSGTEIYPSLIGSYYASAAITTVSLVAGTTFSATGTISLYGVAA
jgi:hypothetical protein